MPVVFNLVADVFLISCSFTAQTVEEPNYQRKEFALQKSSNKLADISVAFAVEILKLVKFLKNQHEAIICNQIGRAGTSIGANIHEAQYAHGKADFVSKLQIALKEANETSYWLLLLAERDGNHQFHYRNMMLSNGEWRSRHVPLKKPGK